MCEVYDYRKAMVQDIKEWIRVNGEESLIDLYSSFDEFREHLYEDMWADDSVTGNGVNGYVDTVNDIEEYLCHNFGLLQEAFEEFEADREKIFNPKYLDTTIRCYLLSECLDRALEEMDITDEDFE